MTTWPEVVLDDIDQGDLLRIVDGDGLYLEAFLSGIDWKRRLLKLDMPTGVTVGIGAMMTMRVEVEFREVRGMWRRKAECEGK